jgi:hypothetical protein
MSDRPLGVSQGGEPVAFDGCGSGIHAGEAVGGLS